MLEPCLQMKCDTSVQLNIFPINTPATVVSDIILLCHTSSAVSKAFDTLNFLSCLSYFAKCCFTGLLTRKSSCMKAKEKWRWGVQNTLVLPSIFGHYTKTNSQTTNNNDITVIKAFFILHSVKLTYLFGNIVLSLHKNTIRGLSPCLHRVFSWLFGAFLVFDTQNTISHTHNNGLIIWLGRQKYSQVLIWCVTIARSYSDLFTFEMQVSVTINLQKVTTKRSKLT